MTMENTFAARMENALAARDAMDLAAAHEAKAEAAITRFSNLPESDRKDPVKRRSFHDILFIARPRAYRERCAAQSAFSLACKQNGLTEKQHAALMRRV